MLNRFLLYCGKLNSLFYRLSDEKFDIEILIFAETTLSVLHLESYVDMITMLSKEEIKKRLEKIYAQIPDFECRHCHECSGPIVWFKPEEIIIRDYLKEHNIEYVKWSREEFAKHKMQCPYLKNDRCSIYPVRPIVCRLQGNVPDLPCKHNSKLMSKEQIDKVKRELDALVRELGSSGVIYGTRKYPKI